jgi:hypothetical protein
MRIDFLEMKIEENLQKKMGEILIDEVKSIISADDGLKLGVHLTNGVFHSVDARDGSRLMTAFTQGALNPGEISGFN